MLRMPAANDHYKLQTYIIWAKKTPWAVVPNWVFGQIRRRFKCLFRHFVFGFWMVRRSTLTSSIRLRIAEASTRRDCIWYIWWDTQWLATQHDDIRAATYQKVSATQICAHNFICAHIWYDDHRDLLLAYPLHLCIFITNNMWYYLYWSIRIWVWLDRSWLEF